MPKKIPKITVYMPNFNYGDYIEEAISSIKKQVFKDWELIIIDDGSTDDSLKILEKYSDDEKITVIKQKNQGLNITNNVAIRLSRGRYIVRVDADEYAFPRVAGGRGYGLGLPPSMRRGARCTVQRPG